MPVSPPSWNCPFSPFGPSLSFLSGRCFCTPVRDIWAPALSPVNSKDHIDPSGDGGWLHWKRSSQLPLEKSCPERLLDWWMGTIFWTLRKGSPVPEPPLPVGSQGKLWACFCEMFLLKERPLKQGGRLPWHPVWPWVGLWASHSLASLYALATVLDRRGW